MALIRCNQKTYQMLIAKKQATGKSMSNLVEYAIFNMPYMIIKENGFKTKRQ